MSEQVIEKPVTGKPVTAGPPPRRVRPGAIMLAVGVVGLMVLPFYAGAFWLQAGLFAMSAAVGAIGLNVLTGAAGQLSIGHAFFLAIGAYSYVWLAAEPEKVSGHELTGMGLPTSLAALLAVLIAGVVGGICAPLAGRLKGASLGVATLALVFIGQHLLFRAEPITGGVNGRSVPPLELFGFAFADTPEQMLVLGVPFGGLERLWYLALAVLLVAAWFARGVLRSRPGRALNTVRDNEIAAGALGVPVSRYRASAFVLSSMYAGLAGVLLALVFQRTVPDYFGLALALDYLAMIVIGGLGSVGGAVLGAVFVSVLPPLLTRYGEAIPLVAEPGAPSGIAPAEAARLVYGAVFVAVLLFLPGGLLSLAQRVRQRSRRRTGPSPTGATTSPATVHDAEEQTR